MPVPPGGGGRAPGRGQKPAQQDPPPWSLQPASAPAFAQMSDPPPLLLSPNRHPPLLLCPLSRGVSRGLSESGSLLLSPRGQRPLRCPRASVQPPNPRSHVCPNPQILPMKPLLPIPASMAEVGEASQPGNCLHSEVGRGQAAAPPEAGSLLSVRCLSAHTQERLARPKCGWSETYTHWASCLGSPTCPIVDPLH